MDVMIGQKLADQEVTKARLGQCRSLGISPNDGAIIWLRMLRVRLTRRGNAVSMVKIRAIAASNIEESPRVPSPIILP